MTDPSRRAAADVAWQTHHDRVQPNWIDYNGHMNVAYYVLVFDRGTDGLFDRLGIGNAYRIRTGCTIFAAEAHVIYKAEVKLGDPLVVESLLLGADAKRVHVFHRLFHADTHVLAATYEAIGLNVDQQARRVVPFADEIARALQLVVAAHARAERPAEVGRRVSPVSGSGHFTVR